MNIHIRIDFTPGTARRVAFVGLTLLLAGLATIAHALPVTFVSNQKLTASQLNANFEALETRLAAVEAMVEAEGPENLTPVVTAWKSYAPTLTTHDGRPVAHQTTSGYYRRVGDSLEARIATVFAAGGDRARSANSVTL